MRIKFKKQPTLEKIIQEELQRVLSEQIRDSGVEPGQSFLGAMMKMAEDLRPLTSYPYDDYKEMTPNEQKDFRKNRIESADIAIKKHIKPFIGKWIYYLDPKGTPGYGQITGSIVEKDFWTFRDGTLGNILLDNIKYGVNTENSKGKLTIGDYFGDDIDCKSPFGDFMADEDGIYYPEGASIAVFDDLSDIPKDGNKP